MTEERTSASRRLVLVDSVHVDAVVLEQALIARGWDVTRTEYAGATAPHGLLNANAVLLALDGDDADAFELLLWLSSLPRRPSVVLLTRRADARVLVPEVLASLGVDHVTPWPARIEEIEAALAAAERGHSLQGVAS
jgi:DNA-binding response OmpR family regulator